MSRKRYVSALRTVLDLPKLSPAKTRQALQELLRLRFGDAVDVGVTREAQARLRGASDEDIETRKTRVYSRILEEAELRRKTRAEFLQGLDVQQAQVSGSRGRLRLDLDGDTAELLALQAYMLVRAVGPDRIRLCEGCGEPFVREGKRLFCSVRCQKRIYMRRYREDK